MTTLPWSWCRLLCCHSWRRTPSHNSTLPGPQPGRQWSPGRTRTTCIFPAGKIISWDSNICEQSVTDQFPNMMNVTFIMHLNVCIAGITVCHLTIGKKSNYDPQSFQNCYSDWKIWENIGELPEFQINNSSEVSSTKFVPGLHIRERL